MRPYIAIVQDSFREALASRVLWILLLGMTLILAALAPFGYREDVPRRIGSRRQLVRTKELAEKIRQDGFFQRSSPAGRIWRTLNQAQRRELSATLNDEEAAASSTLGNVVVKTLNAMIESPDLYEETAWKDAFLGEEARELIARPTAELTQPELQRRNFLLLQAAFRQHFRQRPDRELILTYLGMDLTPVALAGQRLNKTQFRDLLLERIVLPAMIQVFLGFVALLAAILVTSPIIPQMFEAGSVHLLLSKPINRSLLFISKYLGGCFFILINISYLLFGMWLIAGLRFDVWNQGLLLSIPIFLFLFALYYSVSALAGVIWKNPIVSVVVTIAFSCACWVVSTVHLFIDTQIALEQRLVQAIAVEDDWVARNESGRTFVWSADQNAWESSPGARSRTVVVSKLAYDAKAKRLAALRGSRRGPFNPTASGNLAVGSLADGWRMESGPATPSNVKTLMSSEQGLLAFGTSGLHQFDGRLDAGSGSRLLDRIGLQLPSFGAAFRDVSPADGWDLVTPCSAAASHDGLVAAVVNRGELLLLRRSRSSERFKVEARRKILDDDQTRTAVAVTADHILFGDSNGRLILLAVNDQLDVIAETTPASESYVRYLTASPKGEQFAALLHNGQLWTSLGDGDLSRADVVGQGDISGADFDSNGRLVAIDRWQRVTTYEVTAGKLKQTHQLDPAPTTLQTAFKLVVEPVYAIFPKPARLKDTTDYLLSNQRESLLDLDSTDDIADLTRDLNPWAPVQATLIFIGLILAVGCWYVQRQEF